MSEPQELPSWDLLRELPLNADLRRLIDHFWQMPPVVDLFMRTLAAHEAPESLDRDQACEFVAQALFAPAVLDAATRERICYLWAQRPPWSTVNWMKAPRFARAVDLLYMREREAHNARFSQAVEDALGQERPEQL